MAAVLLKTSNKVFVMPAKAGIQKHFSEGKIGRLDSRFRGNDAERGGNDAGKADFQQSS